MGKGHWQTLGWALCLLPVSLPAVGDEAPSPAQATTPAVPFVFRTELPREQIQGLQGLLLQLRNDVGRYLQLPESPQPIEIHLLPDRSSYQRYLQRHAPDVPFHEALFIKDQAGGRVLAYRGTDLESNLRHECTHALLHMALPFVPLWLDEGLAEYFEVRPELRFKGHPHLRRIRLGTRWNTYSTPLDLERIPSTHEMDEVGYRWSWAWVHFLLHESPQSYAELTSYLADVRQGRTTEALSQRLQSRIPDLERRFVQHFRSL